MHCGDGSVTVWRRGVDMAGAKEENWKNRAYFRTTKKIISYIFERKKKVVNET